MKQDSFYKREPESYFDYKEKSFKSYRSEFDELLSKINGSSLKQEDKRYLRIQFAEKLMSKFY